MIYFDSAATSFQKPASVIQSMQTAMYSMSSPGRGAYKSAMRAADLVLDCRTELADMFHVSDPERVIFTHSATEALNIAVFDLVRPHARVLISGFEHNAVTRPLHALDADIIPIGRTLFDYESMMRELKRELPRADVAVFTHVSNVFGYILPLEDIAGQCNAYGVPLIIDASQSAGILPLDFGRLGAAYCAMPGHKGLLGPQGTGILLCGRVPSPLLYGGTGTDSINPFMPESLPERMEAGTHNIPGIAGLLAGVRWVKERSPETISSHEKALMRLFVNNIRTIKGITVFHTPDEYKMSGVVSICSEKTDSETLAYRLGQQGIAVRAGLHCAPLAHESAGTLESGTVRFSFSPFNKRSEVLKSVQVLKKIMAE